MKRRHLLRSSAFAGTYSMLSPFASAQGANDHLRVVVIGVKGRGGSHISAVLSHPKAKLVGLCDVDSEQLDRRVAELSKKEKITGLKTYRDYRKVCEDPDVDAICIATTNHTHAVIALTAAAAGKHAYIEKPVSHNVWEGKKLAEGQKKYGTVLAHGFQRRSETCWAEAFAWIAEGHLGKLKLARGFCYKPRKSIGRVAAPVAPPQTVDYDLWSGPREILPNQRKQFHYDWHWQSRYGNGDLGNQGPHQLDVCRWALGDPMILPPAVLSIGGRYGYDDDGDTANTQILYVDHKPAPILFEVRGLPKKGLDWGSGMPDFRGVTIGNILEYEGGSLLGGHGPSCRVVDGDGQLVKEFKGGQNHFHQFFDACLGGKQNPLHSAENGHYSAALAHLGSHALALGKELSGEQIKASLSGNPEVGDAVERMMAHFEANGIGSTKPGLGAPLTTDGQNFTGEFGASAMKLDREVYREGHTLL